MEPESIIEEEKPDDRIATLFFQGNMAGRCQGL
jgi:hypothetical protein